MGLHKIGYRQSEQFHTLWDLRIWVQLLIERYDVIDHVCALCEFILGSGDLFRCEKTAFVKMGEQGKDEMSV